MAEDIILVGVDDSRQARAALRWAAEMARATGSRLVGLHVLEWPPTSELYAYSVVADEVYPDPPVELEDMYREPSEEAFAEVDPEPGWTLRFARGQAGRVLVEESRHARMLVLGAREHTGIMRLLNGSTGHYCLNHVQCPLVAVPLPSPHDDTSVSDGGAVAARS